MSKYSSQSDINDELIRKFTKEPDHQEAEEYVGKVLSKVGIDADNATATPLLKRLAVCYATYKRAFYESKTKDDIFYQKYISYETELKGLTADVIRNSDKDESRIFAETFRG